MHQYDLDLQDLRHLCAQLQQNVGQANATLVKHLRHRDKTLSKLQRNCDIITAILQAASLKRRKLYLKDIIFTYQFIRDENRRFC
jgi:hypothetical protein